MRGLLLLVAVAACRGEGDARPEGHRRMVALLAEIRDRTNDENPWLGDRRARELREAVRRLSGADDPRACALHAQLGMAELILGNEEAATEHLLESSRLGEFSGAELSLVWQSRSADTVGLNLGIAFLRIGETRNCCARPTAENCILPIEGGGHAVTILSQERQ